MPLPPSIDFDKVLQPVLKDVTDALRTWLEGVPVEEPAFMNHLTGRLNKRRRCDVGLESPVAMETQLSVLHRKGPKQTDLYGTDLAVTVEVEPKQFLKTAFFQFKMCRAFRAQVDKRQYVDATTDPRVRDRAFVFAIEPARQTVRLTSMNDLGPEMATVNSSKDFDTAHWNGLSEWLLGWFECSIGPSSLENPAQGPEPLLRTFAILAPILYSEGGLLAEQPDILPARSWLQVRFFPGEFRR